MKKKIILLFIVFVFIISLCNMVFSDVIVDPFIYKTEKNNISTSNSQNISGSNSSIYCIILGGIAVTVGTTTLIILKTRRKNG